MGGFGGLLLVMVAAGGAYFLLSRGAASGSSGGSAGGGQSQSVPGLNDFNVFNNWLGDMTKTVGIRNNNPGNLKWSAVNNWVGQISKDAGGHIVFDKPENGIRALNRTLSTYARTGRDTARKIIFGNGIQAGYAEGNREQYVSFIVGRTGKGADVVLGSGDRLALVKAIIHFENGSNPYSDEFITYAMGL